MPTPRPLPLLAVPLLFAVACGDDDAAQADAATNDAAADAAGADARPDAAPPADAMPRPDARPAELTCLGAELPTTAPASVTVTGYTFTVGIGGQSALTDVALQGYSAANDQPLSGATATSDGNGDFTLTAQTGGTPLDAYVAASKDTYLKTYLYPPTPIFEDISGGGVVMMQESLFPLLANVAGATQPTDKGFMVVVVLDCEGNTVEGASITTNPPADVRYLSGQLPDASATSTDPSGVAMVFNVPPGAVTVDAEVSGMSLREHTVNVGVASGAEGAITTTAIIP